MPLLLSSRPSAFAPSAVASTTLAAALLAGAAQAQSLAFCDFDAGPQGWTLDVSAEWIAGGGNPGGYLHGSISEPTNTTPFASAPAAYLGSWTALDGVGAIHFDYRRFSNGGGSVLAYLPLAIEITGGTANPAGRAVWNGPTIVQPGDWKGYVARIRAADWTVTAGSWSDILTNVRSMRMQLELVSNTREPEDSNGIDNVRLCASDSGADLDGDGAADAADLGLLLGAWGGTGADINGDGTTDGADLGLLLGAWTG